jgi:hypothetical protein
VVAGDRDGGVPGDGLLWREGVAAVGSLQVKQCTVDGMAARCGSLIVAEDRLTGRGRTIAVRFVVIPATGADRAADPLAYFAGGPGDSAVDEIPASCQLFRS